MPQPLSTDEVYQGRAIQQAGVKPHPAAFVSERKSGRTGRQTNPPQRDEGPSANLL